MLALAVAFVFQACRGIDPDPNPQHAIGFGAVETKAGATKDNIAANGSAFIVRGSVSTGSTWSSSTATTLFDGVTVTSNGSTWTYSPLQYWYESCAYRFRAVWPATAFGTGKASYSDNLIDGNATIYDFTADGATDLLLSDIAEVTTNANAVPNSTGQKVNLDFKHILSRIDVSLKAEGENYYVTEVKIDGIYNSGDFSASSESWVPSGSSTSFTQEYSTSGTEISNSEFDAVWSDGVYLIPQSLTGVTLSVSFTVGTGGDPITLTANLGTDSWLPGKNYKYQATISGKAIEFTAKVVDWVDGGTTTLTK